ncbi:MAG: hypothetical protein ACI8XX_000330 [Polaribacter sp.]|jgi:hypothetical protein
MLYGSVSRSTLCPSPSIESYFQNSETDSDLLTPKVQGLVALLILRLLQNHALSRYRAYKISPYFNQSFKNKETNQVDRVFWSSLL